MDYFWVWSWVFRPYKWDNRLNDVRLKSNIDQLMLNVNIYNDFFVFAYFTYKNKKVLIQKHWNLIYD